jgi:hypothetical protein
MVIARKAPDREDFDSGDARESAGQAQLVLSGPERLMFQI